MRLGLVHQWRRLISKSIGSLALDAFLQWFSHERQHGDLALLPHGSGADSKLNEDQLRLLANLVSKSPDSTSEQLRERIKNQACVEVSITTTWTRWDCREEESVRAAEADPLERAGFR